MSAILSVDDLNDFISPGVACIKPVETLPKQLPQPAGDPYEVTTEDRLAAIAAEATPAQISLTDCLACSGCVTSAEAVLISLQSHEEVLNTLNNYRSVSVQEYLTARDAGEILDDVKIFAASISPQSRASLAATYGWTEGQAGRMVEQLLKGPHGLRTGGRYKSGFEWIIDTNVLREVCRSASIKELDEALASQQGRNEKDATSSIGRQTSNGIVSGQPKLPILASACPGWICYAEKTHPHVLPHISRLKSPQALAGTMLKSVLARTYGIPPDKVWHVAIMPCFDKKLEASREELTDIYWQSSSSTSPDQLNRGIRDVDCVITARELLMLADSRGISFPNLPPVSEDHNMSTSTESSSNAHVFPDARLNAFLFPTTLRPSLRSSSADGSSGGYARHLLLSHARRHPGSSIQVERGRNSDVIEYHLISANGETLLKTARYYGFRNIQNIVRRLKPARKSKMPGARGGMAVRRPVGAHNSDVASQGVGGEFAYIEVMACPGGCTNGGGQVKVDDVASLKGMKTDDGIPRRAGPHEQKEWLANVDEAYFSGSASSSASEEEEEQYDGIAAAAGIDHVSKTRDTSDWDENDSNADEDEYIKDVLRHWAEITDVPLNKLLLTTFREVESDVGKSKGGGTDGDMERVAGLASSIGGGW